MQFIAVPSLDALHGTCIKLTPYGTDIIITDKTKKNGFQGSIDKTTTVSIKVRDDHTLPSLYWYHLHGE